MKKKDILAHRLKELMTKKELSQAKLAELTKITPAAISQIINGKRYPTVPILQKIARTLDVSLDYLSGKTSNNSEDNLMKDKNFISFFRNFKELNVSDKEIIKQNIEFLNERNKNRKKNNES